MRTIALVLAALASCAGRDAESDGFRKVLESTQVDVSFDEVPWVLVLDELHERTRLNFLADG